MRSTTSCLILVVLWALLTPRAALAQQNGAVLVLKVLSHSSGEPLIDAQVRIPSRDLVQITDRDGIARLGGIPAGSHVVEVGRIGYRTESLVVEFLPRQRLDGEVELMDAPVTLDSLQVTATRHSRSLSRTGFYSRQRMGFGTFLGRDQIRRRGIRAIDAVQGVQRTRLRPSRTASGYAVLQRRFGGDCHVLIWIDGVPASAADLGNLHSDQIAAMEVYHGEHLPMQFNQLGPKGFSHCGAVVVWTSLTTSQLGRGS